MTHIPDALRQFVFSRANAKCEYCLLAGAYTIKRHEIDHIRAIKHGGATVANNLCLSCFDWNRYKGNDLASIDQLTGQIVPLFNPRSDLWNDHFGLDRGSITPQSAVGRVTEFVLKFNIQDRVDERLILIKTGLYP